MSSKTAVYLHIVFTTKHRMPTIPFEYREDVYRYIWRELKDMGCFLFRIGGIQNHIHMLIDLKPNVSLSALMARIKSMSSDWLRKDPRFTNFQGWSNGYYAASVTPEEKGNVIEYIKNQPQHHLGIDFENEIKSFCLYNGMLIDDDDLDN